jgi:hypothetical protein
VVLEIEHYSQFFFCLHMRSERRRFLPTTAYKFSFLSFVVVFFCTLSESGVVFWELENSNSQSFQHYTVKEKGGGHRIKAYKTLQHGLEVQENNGGIRAMGKAHKHDYMTSINYTRA